MPNNVQTQLQRAIEMKGKVEVFSNVLTQKMNNLRNTLESHVRAGFPEDIARTYYSKYFVHDNEIISNLSSKMRNNHIAYLDEVIKYLNGAITVQ